MVYDLMTGRKLKQQAAKVGFAIQSPLGAWCHLVWQVRSGAYRSRDIGSDLSAQFHRALRTSI